MIMLEELNFGSLLLRRCWHRSCWEGSCSVVRSLSGVSILAFDAMVQNDLRGEVGVKTRSLKISSIVVRTRLQTAHQVAELTEPNKRINYQYTFREEDRFASLCYDQASQTLPFRIPWSRVKMLCSSVRAEEISATHQMGRKADLKPKRLVREPNEMGARRLEISYTTIQESIGHPL